MLRPFARNEASHTVWRAVCCFLDGKRKSRSFNQLILNDKENTHEHKHREQDQRHFS
jgi:hypothetical protein